MKNFKNYIAIFLLIMVSACSGGEGVCLGPDANDDGKYVASQPKSKSGNDAKAIDAYLLEAQIISKIVDKLKMKVVGENGEWGAVQKMFDGIVKNEYYTSAIGAMFTLAIIFYGIGVSTGIIQVTVGDAVIRLAKIGIIAYTAANWDLFYNVIASFFINGTDELMIYFTKTFEPIFSIQEGTTKPEDGNLLFGDLDKFMAAIFSVHMMAIISALFNVFGDGSSGPFSLVYALVLMLSLFHLVQSIIEVVTIYAISLFAKALLFAVAPIFLSFMLFNQTKQMFDTWLKQLINYSLQPVIVMSFVGMFIALISPLITEVLQMKVCLKEGGSSGVGGQQWIIKGAHGSINEAPPISLQTLMLLFMFSWIFNRYISFTKKIATAMTMTLAGDASSAISWNQAQASGAGGLGGRGTLTEVGIQTGALKRAR